MQKLFFAMQSSVFVMCISVLPLEQGALGSTDLPQIDEESVSESIAAPTIDEESVMVSPVTTESAQADQMRDVVIYVQDVNVVDSEVLEVPRSISNQEPSNISGSHRVAHMLKSLSFRAVALPLKVCVDSFNICMSALVDSAIGTLQSVVPLMVFPKNLSKGEIAYQFISFKDNLNAAAIGAITDISISSAALAVDLIALWRTAVAAQRHAADQNHHHGHRSTYYGLAISCTLSTARLIAFVVTKRIVQSVVSSVHSMRQEGTYVPSEIDYQLGLMNAEVISAVSVSATFLSAVLIFVVPFFKDNQTLYQVVLKYLTVSPRVSDVNPST